MEENESEISKPPRAAERKERPINPPPVHTRLSDSHFNYVDRVRIRDQGHFNGPGRTGGWRHRSLSSIDLSSNSSRSKDFNCSGQEIYSRVNGVRDYEDFYAVNNKVKKNNSLYDHIERKTHAEPASTSGGGNHNNTACSLRRTRSLAVIREETYRDLRITGVRNKRSQLIPRAKLIEKEIFREKYRKKNSEGETDSVKSHSSQGSADFYTNLKRLDIIGVTSDELIGGRGGREGGPRKEKANWQTEKSDDLDSLDSSYFRNSSHQPASTRQDTSRIAFTTDTETPQHFHTTAHSHLADTTTSNSDYCPEEHARQQQRTEISIAETESLLGIKLLDDVLKSEEHNLLSESNTINSKRTSSICEKPVTKLIIRLDGNSTPSRRSSSVDNHHQNHAKRERSAPVNDFYKTRDEIKSIVSYDSIYLSSEVASDEDDNLYSKPSEVYVSNNHSGDTDTVEISLDDYDEISDPTLKEYSETQSKVHSTPSERAARAHIDDILEDESCLDTLYSQVNKSKPKIVGVEPKTSFASSTKSGSDKLSIVRSERYSALSNRSSLGGGESHSSQNQKGHSRYKKNSRVTSAHQNHHYKEKRESGLAHSPQDNHYYSLPDINIGKLLSNSEKIDEKLRLSSEASSSELNLSSNYDATINYANRQQRRRQRENCELILATDANTVDELPREVPSIEVETPYKDTNDRANQELDDRAPTSLDTFGSDPESLPPNLFTVSIGGKQVIVDEVDKLHFENLKKSGRQNSAVQRSNSLRDNEVLKESIAARNSEIKAYIKNNNSRTEQHRNNREIARAEVRQEQGDGSLEKDIKDYFEERLLNKVNEVNDNHFPRAQPSVPPPPPTLGEKLSQSSSVPNKKHVKYSPYEMPRPQIMNVVHSGHKAAAAAAPEKDKIPPPALEQVQEEEDINPAQAVEAQQEFHEKVDSIRCYWSKLAVSPTAGQENDDDDGDDHHHHHQQQQQQRDEVDQVAKEGANDTLATCHTNVDGMVKQLEREADTNLGSRRHRLQNHFLKQHLNRPTVEIVEFDDKTQTAVVKARSAENAVFDHVRYKVVKTETFQKNLLSQKHKEAQFDGLMQYLQDYSFQELLANNNVVIIEPVRTKIEIISEKPVSNANQRNPACKITGVRVNKELIDEELPTPDTVRNVRKLFEGSSLLRVRSVSKDNLAVNTSTMAIESALGGGGGGGAGLGGFQAAKAAAVANLKGCAAADVKQNLAVDTTCGDVAQVMRSKWDAASMSSGVSSGELSSPCECTDISAAEAGNRISAYSGGGDEHLDDGKCYDPSYVSQDVLEKIRARGSTVTYYGGKVLDKRSCANGIMQDMYKNRCIACQPLTCPDPDEVHDKMNFSESTNYLGVRFKLVKSNSCSSRLELVGTGKINSLQQHQQLNQQISQNLKRDEEKRRSILHRLQQQSANGSVSAAEAARATPGVAEDQAQLNGAPVVAANRPEDAQSVSSEKCVKQIVERLETTTAARQTSGATAIVPRIIESKCIEKLAGHDAPPVTEKLPAEGERLTAEAPVVTVNNSISIAGGGGGGGGGGGASPLPASSTADGGGREVPLKGQVKKRQESIYAATSEVQQQSQKSPQQIVKAKVVRNRNVDLALSIVKNQKNTISPREETTAAAAAAPPATNMGQFREAKDALKITEQQRPVLTTFSQQHHLLKQHHHKGKRGGHSGKDAPAKIKTGQADKSNTAKGDVVEKIYNEEEAAAANATHEEHSADGQKLIKWSSLNAKFDEKFYVTNDSKLRQKKIYDEMEFEEFEVYDATNECYDSLNSDK